MSAALRAATACSALVLLTPTAHLTPAAHADDAAATVVRVTQVAGHTVGPNFCIYDGRIRYVLKAADGTVAQRLPWSRWRFQAGTKSACHPELNHKVRVVVAGVGS